MVKILMGLAAVVVIAVGGFFGYEFYTQHRITSEVEAAFAQIRAGGGKASHGADVSRYEGETQVDGHF